MTTVKIDVRLSQSADANALATLHRDAWRYAYRGIIPGLTLERMLAHRGEGWWRRMHRAGGATAILAFDGTPAGYATFGRSRTYRPAPEGEIYELYLGPEYHGAGLGRRLFKAARGALRQRGLRGLSVWSLADNDVACRFYTGVGGSERARAVERIGGVRLPMIEFYWS